MEYTPTYVMDKKNGVSLDTPFPIKHYYKILFR